MRIGIMVLALCACGCSINLGAGAFAIFAGTGAIGYVWSIKNEQRKTEHRFNELRALSTKILQVCDSSLERGLGASQTAAALLVESRNYLQSLAQVAGDDRELLQEVFDAYISVGDIQGNPNHPNLGRPAGG